MGTQARIGGGIYACVILEGGDRIENKEGVCIKCRRSCYFKHLDYKL